MSERDPTQVFSPMVRGSGAAIVHQHLADSIPGYTLATYDPRWEYAPFAMPWLFRGRAARIVHTSPDYGGFFAQRGVPLVVSFHGFALDAFMRPYSSWVQRIHYASDLRLFVQRALRRAQAVTAVSEFVAEKVMDELGYRGRIRVIPNGVDIGRFTPRPRERNADVTVLFSGNLTRHKGADLLPEIASRLDPGIKIVYTTGLRDHPKLVASERLQAIGSVPHAEMQSCYQQADILLSPSVREGFGLAVGEAMACGLPVVATDGSALRELVVQGEGGILCGIRDVDAFASAINRLASSPEMRETMGRFNRRRMQEHYGLTRMLDAYQALFSELSPA